MITRNFCATSVIWYQILAAAVKSDSAVSWTAEPFSSLRNGPTMLAYEVMKTL